MTENAALQAVADGAGQFSGSFFKTIANDKPGNLICSPLSVDVVVSMAAYGAAGNTAAQMRSALHLPVNDAAGRMGFQSLITFLNDVKDVTLRLANKVYTGVGFQLKREYKELTAGSFLSESQQVDFSNPPAAAGLINFWCEEQTNNRIKDVLKPDDINDCTALVLVNAVYFKGNWESQFNAGATRDRPFHVDRNTVKDVPTMYKKSKFRFGMLPDVKARFIEIPYAGGELSMIVILPDEVDGLRNVEANVDKLNLTRLIGHSCDVELCLPKFKIESTIPVNDALAKLGMIDMFSDSANFSGMADVPLKVSKVVHKAFVEVNEEGSEAAAVSSMMMMMRCAPPPACNFVVDRPFLFVLAAVKRSSDIHTAVPLFYGRVSDPAI